MVVGDVVGVDMPVEVAVMVCDVDGVLDADVVGEVVAVDSRQSAKLPPARCELAAEFRASAAAAHPLAGDTETTNPNWTWTWTETPIRYRPNMAASRAAVPPSSVSSLSMCGGVAVHVSRGAAPGRPRRAWHVPSSALTRPACAPQSVPAGTSKLPNRVHANRAYGAVVVADDVAVLVAVLVAVAVAVDVGDAVTVLVAVAVRDEVCVVDAEVVRDVE